MAADPTAGILGGIGGFGQNFTQAYQGGVSLSQAAARIAAEQDYRNKLIEEKKYWADIENQRYQGQIARQDQADKLKALENNNIGPEAAPFVVPDNPQIQAQRRGMIENAAGADNTDNSLSASQDFGAQLKDITQNAPVNDAQSNWATAKRAAQQTQDRRAADQRQFQDEERKQIIQGQKAVAGIHITPQIRQMQKDEQEAVNYPGENNDYPFRYQAGVNADGTPIYRGRVREYNDSMQRNAKWEPAAHLNNDPENKAYNIQLQALAKAEAELLAGTVKLSDTEAYNKRKYELAHGEGSYDQAKLERIEDKLAKLKGGGTTTAPRSALDPDEAEFSSQYQKR